MAARPAREIRTHTLPNGLTVVLAPDRATPIVAVNLWYRVGSGNERKGRTGFAHLFEHMMFQGSAHVPKNRHFELVERAGGSANATTWFDRTNYYETLPSHQLDLGLWLEADRMGTLPEAMTQEKLDNQRDVVRNERRESYDNQPYGDWHERLHALVFPDDHPYHHSVIGSMEDLAQASLQDVEEFFLTYYRPNNAVLTLAGDFEPEAALARVEHFFGWIPKGPRIPPLPGALDLPARIGRTVRESVTSEVPLPRLFLACRAPSFTDESFYDADVAASVLSDGRASRLYRRLVRERKIAKDVAAFVLPLVSGRSVFFCRITGYPGADPAQLEEALLGELSGLADASQEEVDRAIALGETSFLVQLEQLASRADLLSMHQTYFRDAGRLDGEVERMRAVTPERVRAFAAFAFVPENRAIVTYLPRAADTPRDAGVPRDAAGDAGRGRPSA